MLQRLKPEWFPRRYLNKTTTMIGFKPPCNWRAVDCPMSNDGLWAEGKFTKAELCSDITMHTTRKQGGGGVAPVFYLVATPAGLCVSVSAEKLRRRQMMDSSTDTGSHHAFNSWYESKLAGDCDNLVNRILINGFGADAASFPAEANANLLVSEFGHWASNIRVLSQERKGGTQVDNYYYLPHSKRKLKSKVQLRAFADCVRRVTPDIDAVRNGLNENWERLALERFDNQKSGGVSTSVSTSGGCIGDWADWAVRMRTRGTIIQGSILVLLLLD